MDLLRKYETYEKDKQIHNVCSYILDLGNGVFVKIRPVFKGDYNVLRLSSKEYEK